MQSGYSYLTSKLANITVSDKNTSASAHKCIYKKLQ